MMRIQRSLAGLLAFILLVQPLVVLGAETPYTFAQNSQFLGRVNTSGSTQLADQFVSQSGAFVYSIPFDVPQGIAGVAPSIGVSYSSQNSNNHTAYGYGWSDNISYIERNNLTGLQELYDTHNFISSDHGTLVSTSTTGYGTYVPRESTSIVRYELLSSDVWKMYMTNGTVYTYGSDTNSRLDDPSDTSRVYRWYLERIEDTNGNYIEYSYDKQANQIYIDEITYTNNNLYPGEYSIEWTYATSTAFSNYYPGFKVITDRVVDVIEVKHQNSVIREYDFDYVTSPDSGRALLETVTPTAWNNGASVVLEPYTFDYAESNLSFTEELNFTQIPLEAETNIEIYENFRTVIPVTHADTTYYDGVSEIHGSYYDNDYKEFVFWWNPKLEVWQGGYETTTSEVAREVLRDNQEKIIDNNADAKLDLLRVRKNDGSGSRIYDIYGSYFFTRMQDGLSDINGDGHADIINFDNDNDGAVFFNVPGDAWVKAESNHGWNNIADDIEEVGNVRLIDINNDGLSDVVSYNNAKINKGYFGQFETPYTSIPPGQSTSEDAMDGYIHTDINGDGLIDRLASVGTSTKIHLGQVDGTYLLSGASGIVPSFAKEHNDEFFSSAVWFYDMDGDGLDDVFIPREEDTKVYWNNAEKADRMIEIETISGSTITPEYKRTTELYNNDGTLKNPDLTTPIDVVVDITVQDGMGNTHNTDYDYYGGEFTYVSHDKKRLGGFERIVKTNTSTNSQTTNHYHQGDGDNMSLNEIGDQYEKIGMPYYSVIKDSTTGDVAQETFTLYETATSTAGSLFTTPLQVVTRTYDLGTFSYKDSAVSYTHDVTHGGVLTETQWGEVNYNETTHTITDVDDDKRTIEYEYAAGTHQAYSYFNETKTVNASEVYQGQSPNQDITIPIQDLASVDFNVYNQTNGYVGTNQYTSLGSNYYIKLYRTAFEFDLGAVNVPSNYTLNSLALRFYTDTDNFSQDTLRLYDGTCSATAPYTQTVSCSTTNDPISDWYDPPFSNGTIELNTSINATGTALVSQAIDSDETYTIIMRSNRDDIGVQINSAERYIQPYEESHHTWSPKLVLNYIREEVATIPYFKSSRTTSYSYDNATTTDTTLYYDNLPHGQVGLGNMTTQSQWLDTDNSWIDTDFTYNTHGQPLSVTDARGNVTTTVYDSTSLFPQTVTNDLGHVTTNEYDFVTGQISKTTDPNGVVVKNIYDGFGRLIEKKQSTPSGGMITVETHSYNDNSMPRSVTSAVYHTATPQYVYTYTDGLGRTVQTKQLTSNGNYQTKTYTYDNTGRLVSETLPYVSSASTYESSVPSGTPETTYQYDILDRVTQTTSPTGVESTDYDAWGQSMTNKRGYDKTYSYDAFGNLISVDEEIETLIASSTPQAPTSPYAYKQRITIAGQSGAGSDYQVLLQIGQTSGGDFGLNGNAQHFPQSRNDGGDLQFYAADEITELPFWVEKVDSGVAYVWVKVSDSLDTNQDIYVYYGNPSPTNYSDGEGTFIFFDEFEGGVMDIAKWHTENTNVSISGGIASVNNSTNGYGSVLTKQNFGPETSIRFNGRVAQTWVGTHELGYRCFFNGSGESCSTTTEGKGGATVNSRWQNDPTASRLAYADSGTVQWATFSPNFVNSFHTFEVSRPSVTSQKYYVNNVEKGSATLPYANPSAFRISQYYTGKNGNNELDWLAVRKNIATEPSYSSSNGEESVAFVHDRYRTLAQASTTNTNLGSASELEETIEELQEELSVEASTQEETVEELAEEEANQETKEASPMQEEVVPTQEPNETEIVEDVSSTEVTEEETPTVDTTEVTELAADTTQVDLSVVETTEEEVTDGNLIVTPLEPTVDETTDESVDTDPQTAESENLIPDQSTADLPQEVVVESVETVPTDEVVEISMDTASSTALLSESLTASATSTSEVVEVYQPTTVVATDQPAKSYRYKERIWLLQGKISEKESRLLAVENKINLKRQTLINIESAIGKKTDRIAELESTIEKRLAKDRDVTDQQERLTKNTDRLVKLQERQDRVKTKIDTLFEKQQNIKQGIEKKQDRIEILEEKAEQSADTQTLWITQTLNSIAGVFQPGEVHASSWADPNYAYKQRITVSGQSGAGSDYQVLLQIGENSGGDFHLHGNAQHFPQAKNDGGDLVVYADDESTMLPFWVEQVESGVAYVWVKVSDSLDTDQDIYVYYGNPTPVNHSDGDATFIVFDDFDTGFDTSKFSMGYGSHSGTSNSEIKLAYRDVIRTNQQYSDNVKIGSRHRLTSTGNYALAHLGLAENWNQWAWISGDASLTMTRSNYYNPDVRSYQYYNGGNTMNGETDVNPGTSLNTWILNAGETNQSVSQNHNTLYSSASATTHDNLYAYWAFMDVGDAYFDWVFVAKQTDGAEPAFDATAGEEQYQVQSSNDTTYEWFTDTATTVYKYDSRNQLVKIVDAEGNEREFTYDSLGRQTTAELPHTATSSAATYSYTYDAVGNKTSETRPDGAVINYTYDDLNRLLTIDNPGEGSGAEVTYVYDTATNGVGKLAGTFGDGYSKAYSYDGAGNMSSEAVTAGGGTHTTAYSYTDYGMLDNSTYPDGTVVANTYHNTGDVDSVIRDGTNVVSMDYNHLGQITDKNYHNGIETDFVYDSTQEYRLASKQTTGGSTTLQDLSYMYDDVGNITNITNVGSELLYVKDYTYDSVDRLVGATTTTSSTTDADNYTYSPTGNILTHNGDTYTYTNGTFPQAATTYGANTYTYDANGNLETENNGTDTFTYVYDWNDRLNTISDTSGLIATYTYTDNRQRLKKELPNGSETLYLNNTVESDENGDYTNYVFAGVNRVLTDDGTLHYNHADHLQSSSLTTDSSGLVEQSVDYTPFGSERTNTGSYQTNYTYTDQYFDDETALHYYKSRYYDSDLKRFTSPDPWIGLATLPQSQNKYSYVMNNPLSYTDPTGEVVDLSAKHTEADEAGVHTYVEIRADEGGDLSHLGLEGETRITLGAYSENGFLVGDLTKGLNSHYDYNDPNGNYIGSMTINRPDQFETQTEFEQAVYQSFLDAPNNSGAYSLLSWNWAGQGNSNNFASQLLLDNGVPASEIRGITNLYPTVSTAGISHQPFTPGLAERLPNNHRSSIKSIWSDTVKTINWLLE